MTDCSFAFATRVARPGSHRSIRRRRAPFWALLLLAVPCQAQMVWARRDPDMTAIGVNANGSYGSAYDASRGRHVQFHSEYISASGGYIERVFAFDGENWTTKTSAPSPSLGFNYGATITEDPTGRGRIVRLDGYLGPGRTTQWDPNTGSIASLPNGPYARAFGAFRYVPDIGAVQFGGSSNLGTSDDHTWVWDGAVWRDATGGGVRPPWRYFGAASRGSAAQPFLMFGGLGYASWFNDTWSFDGTNWTQHFPATTPSRRQLHKMAYDPVRNRAVMFGGHLEVGGIARDTWEWDGVNWQAMAPPHSPPEGYPISMNWDPLRRRVVLVGITNAGASTFMPNLPIDTWEWDGTDWTQLNANPTGAHVVVPSARSFPFLAHSLQTDRTILFGGYSQQGVFQVPLRSTWESESRVWQLRAPATSPPASFNGAGAILRSSGELYWLPGQDTFGNSYNQSWNWGGQLWSGQSLSSPISQLAHQVVGSLQSSQLGWVLVRLVTTGTGPALSNTLQLISPFSGVVQPMFPSGGPTPRLGSVMVQSNSPSLVSNGVWLFGGGSPTIGGGTTYYNELWTLTDTGSGGNLAWALQTPASGSVPAPRQDAAAAYHPGQNRICVMGGSSAVGTLSDSWMFDLATRVWTQIAGAGPSARYGAAMTYDASIDRIVLFGGTDGATLLNDIWECDGTTWTQRTTPGTPPARGNATLVHDRASGRSLLFGGIDTTGTRRDLWSYDGSTWSPLLGIGNARPTPRFTQTACFVEQGGSMVVFGGSDGIGELGDTWRFDSTGHWTLGAFGPPARANAAMVYAIVQGQPCGLLFGGYQQGSRLGDTWRYSLASDTWQQLAGGPDARDIHAMAWDRRRNVVVLFGGRANSAFFADDTWEFNCATATWSQRTPAHRPPPRWNAAMAYDESRARNVMTGGYNGAYLNDVWEWDGVDWLQRTPETDSPVPREDAAMTYDAARGRLQMFGGGDGSAYRSDLWELHARIDTAGPGNTSNPQALRFYSQPALGQPLQLGFANPQGFGFYTIGFGPLQQAIAPLPVPPLCEASSIWANAASLLVLGTTEPNIAWNVPNTPLIVGVTLVFQAFAVQQANCWRATDALHVRF